MKPLLLLLLFALPLLHAAEPTVTLAGIQVVFDDGENDFDGFRTFNMQEGYNVALIIRSEGKTMVDFSFPPTAVSMITPVFSSTTRTASR